VKVGNAQTRPEYPSGIQFSWVPNSSHTIEAFNQNYQAPNESNYYRLYQDWSRPSPQPNTTTNPLPITVSATGTYTANFKSNSS